MTNGMLPPTPRFNAEATMRNWRREIRLIAGALEAQIERLERLELEMVTYCAAQTKFVGGTCTISSAEPVARNMLVEMHPDGHATIALDGGNSFTLAPQLAEVFLFLASGDQEPGSKDPLVGWRSREQILEFLARSADHSLRPRYINNLVHRLKEELQRAGYRGKLIQTHRRKGVRLSYKRSAHGAPDRHALAPSTVGWAAGDEKT